jgi:hypothetical protein
MRPANEKHLERLGRRVQAPALAYLANQLGPLARREQRKAALPLEDPIGNEQALMAVTL